MIMVLKMSGKYYATEVALCGSGRDKIEAFLDEGTPVILVDSLDSLEDLGINPDEVIMVEPE